MATFLYQNKKIKNGNIYILNKYSLSRLYLVSCCFFARLNLNL